MKSRLVFDVTTTSKWKSRDVGITRTERNFARYLLADPPSEFTLLFVVKTGKFRWKTLTPEQVSAELGLDRRSEKDPGHVAREEVNREAAAKNSSVRRRAEDAAFRSIRRVGVSVVRTVKSRLPEEAHADFMAVAGHTNMLGRQVVHQWRHKNSNGERIVDGLLVPNGLRGWSGASSEDIYLSMGLDWDDKSMAEIFILKREIGFRCISVCFDLIPCLFPQWIPTDPQLYDRHFADLAYVADLVPCISDTVAESLRDHAISSGLPVPETATVVLGADFPAGDPVPVPSLKGARFVLFVSTIEPRKNHKFLVEVWKRLESEDVKLVFAGRTGWKCEDVLAEMRGDQRLIDRVVHLPSVSDENLIWLYQNCLFSVFPSLYEGWGLPVVESLALGTPCVASTAGSVVEASRGIATHLDTFDGELWLAHLTRLCSDPALLEAARKRTAEAGAALLEEMTWENFGASMCALVADVSAGRRGTRSLSDA
jgi:glycosyltransferase involved in cell wall biosynthesis